MSGALRKQFGKRLKHIRVERGMTQEAFAELLAISVDFLSLIERGINAPSFERLEQFAEALDVEVVYLFDFRGSKPTVRKRARNEG